MKNILKFMNVFMTATVLFIAQTEGQIIKSHAKSHRQASLQKFKSALNALSQTRKRNVKNVPCIQLQKTIGGSGDEDRGAIRAIPGGYITCGSTTSPDGDFHVPANHDYDAYV